MIDYSQLLLLGAFSGLTIFLGLPLAMFQSVSSRLKGFLNALAIGILIFLTVDVLGHAWESAAVAASAAFVGKAPVADAVLDLLAMFGGMAIGLLGLTWYETRYMKESAVRSPIAQTNATESSAGSRKQELQLLQQVNSYRLSMMIAIGIGAHNFSEGLAIGQSYCVRSDRISVNLDNWIRRPQCHGRFRHSRSTDRALKETESPLSRRDRINRGWSHISWNRARYLWSSTLVYILFLAIAGGALIYVSMLMYNSGRRQTTNTVLMLGLFVGLLAGFITDLIVTLGGA